MLAWPQITAIKGANGDRALSKRLGRVKQPDSKQTRAVVSKVSIFSVVCFSVAQQQNIPRSSAGERKHNYQQSWDIYCTAVLDGGRPCSMLRERFQFSAHIITASETADRITDSGAAASPSPPTDLLPPSRRLQLQLPVGADALGQQPLRVGQPLAEVVHVTVELPPLFHGAVEAPAVGRRSSKIKYLSIRDAA